MATAKKTAAKKKPQQNKNLLSIQQAADAIGITRMTLGKMIHRDPRPDYAVQQGNRWYVDHTKMTWKAIVEQAAEKKAVEDAGRSPDVAELRKESAKSKLMEPVLKEQMLRYKLEQEKLEIEKGAKRLIEFEMADYLFFGYIARIQRERLSMAKRATKKIENTILDGMHVKKSPAQIANEIIKIINREQEQILRDVVADQKRELEKWEEER
jgi:hypothetical protein